jgi:hypothetical protein
MKKLFKLLKLLKLAKNLRGSHYGHHRRGYDRWASHERHGQHAYAPLYPRHRSHGRFSNALRVLLGRRLR